jgi:four helix bundle protein
MNHIHTRIYSRSIELADLVREAIDELPPGFAFLAEQLRKASASVVQNFAEGCGKGSRADRRRFFHIAKGSAYEVAAALDVGTHLSALDKRFHERSIDIADHLGAMLTRYR